MERLAAKSYGMIERFVTWVCDCTHPTHLHSSTRTHTHTHTTEAEELGSKELELGEKLITIEIKSNEQGKFVKILEVYM